MPSALILEQIQPQPPPPRKRWTREEIAFLETSGFFEGQRYELVEGELINKMGQNELHAYAIRLLTAFLVGLFGRRGLIQLPIDVSPEDNPTSEPQPDAAVTTAASALTSRQPGSGDIVWLIEVSDSTLRFDLTVKARLYARAAIPDYWVIDLVNRQIIVHRQPAHGDYGSVTVYSEHESASPLESPEAAISFQDLTAADQQPALRIGPAAGEPFIIAKSGRPLVQVTPVGGPPPAPPRLGFLASQFQTPEDFDQMGSTEIEEMFRDRR